MAALSEQIINDDKRMNDTEILVYVLTKGLPEHLQVHPVEDENSEYADADNFFLTENELREYKRLDEKCKNAEDKIKEPISKVLGESEVFDLCDELDLTRGLVAAFNMKIAYRNGLLRGFRLAQFFLQAYDCKKAKRNKKLSTV